MTVGWTDSAAIEAGSAGAVIASAELFSEVGPSVVGLFSAAGADAMEGVEASKPDAVYKTCSFKTLPKDTSTPGVGGKADAMSAVRDNCTEDEELAEFRLCKAWDTLII